MSPQCLVNLVQISATRGSASKLAPVLQLPCAQRLSSNQLCDMISVAGRAQLWSHVPRLCRWVVDTLGRQPQQFNGAPVLAVFVLQSLEDIALEVWAEDNQWPHSS